MDYSGCRVPTLQGSISNKLSYKRCVLAFNFGDGLSNYIFPTSSTLMAICGAAGITYDKWMKFMWKVFLGWSATVCILLIVAQLINYV